MIPEINLASAPEKKVFMSEATVQQCIDMLSDVSVHHEEQITTLFLNTVQTPEKYHDSRLWTADDRRLVLVWYYVNTIKDMIMPFSFFCDCGKQHYDQANLMDILGRYSPLKGKPYRERDFDGEPVTISPLNGAAMEELEMMRLALTDIKEKSGSDSPEYQGQLGNIRIAEVILSTDFLSCADKDADKAREKRETKIKSLPWSRFIDLFKIVKEAQADMHHGLPSVVQDGKIYLLVPDVECQSVEGGPKTLIRVPFRYSDYIPGLL